MKNGINPSIAASIKNAPRDSTVVSSIARKRGFSYPLKLNQLERCPPEEPCVLIMNSKVM